MTTVAITLPDELSEFVAQTVATGDYFGPSDLISSALYSYRDQIELNRMKLERLRKDIADGLEQAARGEFAEFDAESIIAECKRKMAAAESH